MFTFEQIQALQGQGWTANQILDLIKADESSTSKKSSKADKAPTKSVSASKKPAAKTSKKSSASSSTKSREERLTEKYGDKATRTKFVELEKKVATEFLAIGKEEGVYIPRRNYKKVLRTTTESLSGKMNKKVVRKAFLEAAK